MPRIALGNTTVEGLKAAGFVTFSEAEGLTGITLAHPDGVTVSRFVSLESIVNVTEAGVREISKGMNPNEAVNNAVSELANLDLDDDALLALIKARREAKAAKAANEAKAQAALPLAGDDAGNGTDDDDDDNEGGYVDTHDASDPKSMDFDPEYAAMNPRKKGGKR